MSSCEIVLYRKIQDIEHDFSTAQNEYISIFRLCFFFVYLYECRLFGVIAIGYGLRKTTKFANQADSGTSQKHVFINVYMNVSDVRMCSKCQTATGTNLSPEQSRIYFAGSVAFHYLEIKQLLSICASAFEYYTQNVQ